MPMNKLHYEKIIPVDVDSNITEYNKKMSVAFPNFKPLMTREEHIEDLQKEIAKIVEQLETNSNIKTGEKIKVSITVERLPEEH